MPNRSNEHIKKFNQLVEVYGPEGVETIEIISSRETERLEDKRSVIGDREAQVEALGVAEFFDDERETELRESDSMPEPAAVADSQREEMLNRLALIEEALGDAIESGDVLDTSEDLDW